MAGKIRVAVVGGAFAELHIQGFKCCHEFEVVSICRRQKHLAEQTARKYNIERHGTDFDEIIRSSDIDVVSLAVPHHLHYPMTLKAFDKGKHVICEKPLGLNVREAEEMIRRAEEKRLIHQIVFNWRFVPAFFHMKELIEEGEIGSVYHISFNWLGSGRRDKDAPFTWRFSQAEAGYGALGDTGVHGIDLIHWMAGDFKKVISHMGVFVSEHKGTGGGYKRTEVEDSCSFLGELAGGAQVIFHVSSVASCKSVIRLEIHGDKGVLGARLFPRDDDWNGKLYGGKGVMDLRKEILLPERLKCVPMPLPKEYSPRALFFTRFAEKLVIPIQTRQQFSPNFYDGLKAQKVLQALTDSYQQQRWQFLAY